MLEPACLMGVWWLGLCTFICPVLDSKQDSLQFLLSLLQMLCDTCPVVGTFFKGIVVQKAQELHFLWQFSGAASVNHMLFLVMFHIHPSLFTWSKLPSHLTIPSALYVRNVSVPMLSLYLFFLPPFCPYLFVGRVGQHVCAWSSVEISVRRPVQPTLVLLALMSPSLSPLGRSGTLFPRHPFCCVLPGFSA